MTKLTKKAALTCAVALLPLSAFAQSGDEEMPPWMLEPEPAMSEPEPDRYMDEEEGDLPPWMAAEGGRASPSSRSGGGSGAVALPPPGEEVSLDGYDKMMSGLTEDIDARLKQLSLSGDKAAGLPDPSTDNYASIMEQLAADQREIKLLESKIAKAKLAKELWGELNTDDRGELLSEVESLRAANATLQQEAAAREAELAAAAEEAAARAAELEFELEMAKAAPPPPVAEPSGGETPLGTQQVAPPAPPAPPKLLVEAITITAGRRAARISSPGGGIRTYGVGESLGADVGRIESIDQSGVMVKLPKGDIVALKRGTYREAPVEPANIGTDVGGFEEFGTGMDYLDEVSDFANPDGDDDYFVEEGF